MKTVLVTGGSGFLGTHIIIQLLQNGYDVRTTLRSEKKIEELKRILLKECANKLVHISFHICDLVNDKGWKEAISGCDYVLHVASPFPAASPKNEEELITPAREGVLRVLHFSKVAKVQRVVLTSSFAAVGYGHKWKDVTFNEEHWTDISQPDVYPYIKSKAIAERSAWEFIEKEGEEMELTVINPVGIFGPVFNNSSSSVRLISSLLDGTMPAAPKLNFGVVDVRDVAELHLLTMISPMAAGQRFIANQGGCVSLMQIANMLRGRVSNPEKLPKIELPNWLVKVGSHFIKPLKEVAPQVGIVRQSTSKKARILLNWHTRPIEATMLDTANSLIKLQVDG